MELFPEASESYPEASEWFSEASECLFKAFCDFFLDVLLQHADDADKLIQTVL
jgi:hypothetical protein